ncbi:MAG: alpha/beta hydrolase-fold protein [Ferruginibacter sp.]
MIKKTILKILFVCISFSLHAQHQLKIVVKTIPASHANETVYVAGNFNGWSPVISKLVFSEENKEWSASFTLPKDVYEFKFTRGSWDKVQCMPGGADVQNNLVKLESDTTVTAHIAAWKDDYAASTKKHTASANVSIMDTAFFMPQLNSKRRIWIYLPEGYKGSKKHYPVLYMHDGQNIFDEYSAGYGEWGVDECLDSLFKKNVPACIVVGIDNGPERMNEYNPFDNERFGKGKGEDYVEFLVKTLKPYIDGHYRTLASKDNTMLAGSSMGGLISYYAALKYPAVFGKAGIFSPAFWTALPVNNFTDEQAQNITGKYFFYMGGLEGGSYVEDMERIAQKLGANSKCLIYSVVDPDSRHNEQAWRKWFPEFYKWIMADWTNYVIREE